MRAAKKAGHTGTGLWPARTRSRLPLRPRAFRGACPVASLAVAPGGDQGARRPASRQPLPLGAAPQTHQPISSATASPATAQTPACSMRDSDAADERAFAERCEDDRHHFRFIVSPEDAAEMDGPARVHPRVVGAMSNATSEPNSTGSLSITGIPTIRMSMSWSADVPMTVQDLVISRDYISRGFRDRAEERVTLELGPRSEREIQSALEKEVEAERWTGLDRALRNIADEGAGDRRSASWRAGRGSRASPADAWPSCQARAPRPCRTGRPGLLDVEAGP